MAASAEESWWRSPRTWVGGTALVDLVARAPEDIIAPVLSLLGGSFGGPSVGFVTTWLLIAVVFYLFAPLAYSLSDVLPREETGFRAIFAGSGVVIGILLAKPLFSAVTATLSLLAVFTLSGGVFLSYLSWVHEWDLLDPQGPASELLDPFWPNQDATTEIESTLEQDGVYRPLAVGLHLGTVAVALALPVLLAGVLAVILRSAYPFPDLLFLGWVVGAALSARVSIGPSKDQVLDRQFDLERFFVDALENAARSMQGAYSTATILFGMFVAATYLVLTTELVPYFPTVTIGFAPVITIGDPTGFVEVWNYAGTVVLLVSAGGFALWAWIREWQRLPYFLDQWEDRETTTGQPVSRPSGLVALPAAVGGILITLIVLETNFVSDSFPGYVFAISWPVVVGIGGVAGLRTIKQPPQPVTYENYWIGGGVLLELLSLAPGVLQTGDPGMIVFLMFLVVFSTGYPVAHRHTTGATGRYEYALVWYLFGWAGLLLAVRPFLPPETRGWVFVFVAVSLIFGTVSGLVKRFDL